MILTPKAHAMQLESIGCLNADLACGILFSSSHNYDTVARRTSWGAGWETVDQSVELDAMAYTHIHAEHIPSAQRTRLDYIQFANGAIDTYMAKGFHPNFYFSMEIADVCRAYAMALPEPGGADDADA